MSGLTLIIIYFAGCVLMALRVSWHILFQMDKYDRRYSNVLSTFWLDTILWPLFILRPGSLIQLKFITNVWDKGQAELARELDRLSQNPPPCSSAIRYVPKRDESGNCNSEFIFDAAEVEGIMTKRLSELPIEQHGRYPEILNWLRQRDSSCTEPADVPVAWNQHFLNVAVGMMKRELGQVKCGECGEVIPQDQISLDSGPMTMVTSGWAYNVWRCPLQHKLLTKDAMHFYIRRAD